MTRAPRGRGIFVVTLLVCLGFVAVPARAELVFFNTGRSLSVKSHRVDGDSLVLQLRGGGEIVCDSAIVSITTPCPAKAASPCTSIGSTSLPS